MTSVKRARVAAVAACGLLLALAPSSFAQQTEKAKELGKRMMCMCGCNEILTECNHVGCQSSGKMLQELDERIARGEPDDLMMQSFVQEYGERVMLVPGTKGFNGIVWFMPIAFVAGGLVLIRWVTLRWRQRAAAAPAVHVSADLLARARSEAERED
jgi:cytochrome c-type biogenesis protein CcmH/NrfF